MSRRKQVAAVVGALGLATIVGPNAFALSGPNGNKGPVGIPGRDGARSAPSHDGVDGKNASKGHQGQAGDDGVVIPRNKAGQLGRARGANARLGRGVARLVRARAAAARAAGIDLNP